CLYLSPATSYGRLSGSFRKGKPRAPEKTDRRQPSSPRDPTTRCRAPWVPGPPGTTRRHFLFEARSAGSLRKSLARDGEALPAINDLRNERPYKIAPQNYRPPA